MRHFFIFDLFMYWILFTEFITTSILNISFSLNISIFFSLKISHKVRIDFFIMELIDSIHSVYYIGEKQRFSPIFILKNLTNNKNLLRFLFFQSKKSSPPVFFFFWMDVISSDWIFIYLFSIILLHLHFVWWKKCPVKKRQRWRKEFHLELKFFFKNLIQITFDIFFEMFSSCFVCLFSHHQHDHRRRRKKNIVVFDKYFYQNFE